MNRTAQILAPLAAVLLTLAAAEGISWITLEFAPELPSSFPTPQTSSPFSLPETLSKMPVIPKELPLYDDRVHIAADTSATNVGALWIPHPNQATPVRYIDLDDGRLLWESKTTTDAFGRRIPPWQEDRKTTAKRHIFAIGCSITWGHGVNDDETFLAQISKRSSDLITYNAGFEGYSIGESLIRAQTTNVLDDITPQKGIGIYVLFDGHLPRFFEGASVVGRWRDHGIGIVETSPGHFQSFADDGPRWKAWRAFSQLWVQSSFVKLFGLDLPPLTEARVDQFMRAIKAFRELYWRKTSRDNPFVVVLFPYNHDETLLRAGLNRAEIPYLDYAFTRMRPYLKGQDMIVGDGHPTAESHAIFSVPLERDLRAVMDASAKEK